MGNGPALAAVMHGDVRSEHMMDDAEPGSTFRGLPLTPEQDSEIRHYIHVRSRGGMAWDTRELRSIIADMLDPPELALDDGQALDAGMAAQRPAAADDDYRDRNAPHGDSDA